jgi:hypothetical protein
MNNAQKTLLQIVSCLVILKAENYINFTNTPTPQDVLCYAEMLHEIVVSHYYKSSDYFWI